MTKLQPSPLCLLLLALMASGASANANDFPTAERVLGVQACMQKHQGPFYEMLHKCACALDEVAAQLSFAEYVELSTIANAMTIAGERGNGMRDNESLKAPFARFKQINKQAEKACFIVPSASLR
jgi:hypothetical protein